MHRLLHVDSSERVLGSYSRQLTARMVRAFTTSIPSLEVEYLDVVAEAQVMVSSLLTCPTEVNKQIDSLQRADVIVLGAPCYNGGVPWALKTFVDAAWRAGITVTTKRLAASHPCKVRSAVIVTSYGGPGLDPDGVDIHRRTLMYYMHRIGVEKTTFVEVRGTENPGFVLDADALDSMIRKAVTMSSDSLL